MSEQEIRKILAAKLKECRERAGLTAKEAGAAIGKSEKTVNAWEHGRGQPDADMLFTLCRLYNIENISVFYGIKEEPLSLSKEEAELIEHFRSLNAMGKDLLLNTAKTFAGNPDMRKEGQHASVI